MLQTQVQQQIEVLKTLVPEFIYGYNEDTLETVVGNLLVSQQKTVAIAESCSVGYVTYSIGQVPGCSRYLMGSVVAYHNQAKIRQLGIKAETLATYGAVSEETAREMAENVRSVFGTSIGVASTGIAGPDGGTTDKPVGTVWIAYADETQTVAKKLQLGTDRILTIQLTALHVLNLIRQSLIVQQ
jgi:nicotinamide-nucleotide amidase